MSKLRLDYFLGLGLKLVKLDKYTLWRRDYVITGEDNALALNTEDKNNNERFITSFAPRKNTGEQPCGDDVPVVVVMTDGSKRKFGGDSGVMRIASWVVPISLNPFKAAVSWKPNIDELIKMQDEHDKKLATHKPQRTKTEYVKVDYEDIFKFIGIGNGGLYQKLSDDTFSQLALLDDAYTYCEELYTKVVREVTWQDGLSEYARKESIQLAMPFSEKAQFFNMGNVEESKFIAMCHLVASMTDNK